MFYDTFKLQLSWKKNIFNFRFHANRKKKAFPDNAINFL